MEVGAFKKPANAIPRLPKLPKRVADLVNVDPRLAALLPLVGQIRALASFNPLNFANAQLANLKAEIASRARQLAIAKLNAIGTPSFFPEDLATTALTRIRDAQEQVEELQEMAKALQDQIEGGLDTATEYVDLLNV